MPLILGHSSAFVVRQGRQSRMSSNASSTASSAPSSVDQQHVHSHSNSDSGLSSLTGNINAIEMIMDGWEYNQNRLRRWC